MFEYRMLKAADGCSVGVSTWSPLQKSELAGRIMAGPWVILTMKKAFSKNFFFMKIHLLHAYYLRFDWSGWIVLIKVRFSLRREWSGQSVLTNGKRP